MARSSPTYRPQVAFLDHVYAVVEASTADEIARCDFLRGFGRLEVATTVADGETWMGRHLFGTVDLMVFPAQPAEPSVQPGRCRDDNDTERHDRQEEAGALG